MALIGVACNSAFADISPETGQNFEPYAFSTGLMKSLATACFGSDAPIVADIAAANTKFGETLMRYGMPQDVIAENADKGRKEVERLFQSKAKDEVCIDKVTTVLSDWPKTVDSAIANLDAQENAP